MKNVINNYDKKKTVLFDGIKPVGPLAFAMLNYVFIKNFRATKKKGPSLTN